MTPGGILATILAKKRDEIARLDGEALRRAAQVAPPARPFAAALRRPAGAAVRVLAEIKRASPSAGAIRAGADPVAIARDYEEHGAAAVSVLTDREFFAGELAFLGAVRAAIDLPLLRKDFLIDEVQIAEARAAGADAVLVIAAAVDDIGSLVAAARFWGMDTLVEVHDDGELDRAIAAGATLIGVNHRNLSTFAIDMDLTARLAPRLPANAVLVAESGIKTPADIARLGQAGAHAVLVGETLMRAPSPGAALAALLEAPP